jgi:hypothetical protein
LCFFSSLRFQTMDKVQKPTNFDFTFTFPWTWSLLAFIYYVFQHLLQTLMYFNEAYRATQNVREEIFLILWCATLLFSRNALHPSLVWAFSMKMHAQPFSETPAIV